MKNTIRILPDTPFARLISAATGVEFVVTADPLGRWATVTIPDNDHRGDEHKLQIGAAPGPIGTPPRLRPYASGVYGELEDLQRRRVELEALCRFADLVILACRGALSRDDIDAVAATDLAMKIDTTSDEADDMVGDVLALALAHDLEIGDTGSPAECFVDLALAIRELRVMALERESTQVDARIGEYVSSDETVTTT